MSFQNRIQTVPYTLKKSVQIWLAIGVFMVIMQVVIGGITRLTGSGLSITKWEIVTGALPPTSTAQWEEEFELYKATPQYAKINQGMSLNEFKFIYFWEYFHRVWARSIGLVFIFPFLFFLRKKWLPKPFVRKLWGVVIMGAVVASFGWIMVASGLIDRPWVNAYKLTLHLSLALVLFSYLLWITFESFQPKKIVINNNQLKNFARAITIVIAVQIVLGGLMSGMKAGLVAPTWPDMNGEIISSKLFHKEMWNVENFVNYDTSDFMPLLVQAFHRTTAYILTILIGIFFWRARKINVQPFKTGVRLLLGMLIVQFTLGVITIINSLGSIPVSWGVFHQAGAIFLLGIALFVNYQFSLGAAKMSKESLRE